MTVVTTKSTPVHFFTSLTQAAYFSKYNPTDKMFPFIMGGVDYEAFVDDEGWILVASSLPPNRGGRLMQNLRRVTEGSGRILKQGFFTSIEADDIAEIKIEGFHVGTRRFYLTTDEIVMLNRLRNFKTFTEYANDNTYWDNKGVAGITVRDRPSTRAQSLDRAIYHAMGTTHDLHWIPSLNLYGTTQGSQQMNLWIRGKQEEI